MQWGLLIGILLVLFLIGCAPQRPPEYVCNDPLVTIKGECCLDENKNGVCDNRETEEKKNKSEDIIKIEEDTKIIIHPGKEMNIKFEDLPMTVYVSQKSKISYEEGGEKNWIVVDDIEDDFVRLQTKNDVVWIDLGRGAIADKLLIEFEKLDPPKGNVHAVFRVSEAQ